MFFFFKQKTAYEMRISDWSSDVCSSDLATTVGATAGAGGGAWRSQPAAHAAMRIQPASRMSGLHWLDARDGSETPARQRCAGDRKSVVEGKSVSVRVDLGGRRIITKKKKQKHKVPGIYTSNK